LNYSNIHAHKEPSDLLLQDYQRVVTKDPSFLKTLLMK